MLNESRLKTKIKAAFDESGETKDAVGAIDRIAGKLAQAIVEEIKQLNIKYTGGLGTTSGIPVSGILNHTVE